MLPLGHAAIAYLCYVGYAVVSTHRLPARSALLSLFLGSQLPDVIDKPLAYWNVLTYGRSLAHSVFSFLLISALVWWAAQRLQGRWNRTTWQDRIRLTAPAGLAIGYGSHLLGDSYRVVLTGQYADARFLFYPLYTMPESHADEIPPWLRLLQIYQNMETHPQIRIIIVSLALFIGLRIYARRNQNTHVSTEK